MTRFDEALGRLERAIARLEAAGAALAVKGETAEAAEAENRRLRAAAGDFAARVEGAPARGDRALGEGG